MDDLNSKIVELQILVTRLEEQLRGANKALDLAQNNSSALIAQALSVIAILTAVYAVFHK